ncbi:MAG: glycosyltransferase family 2 protein [Thermoanaerobaculia bacterium]|nr:glycosyltransferase family 2 protein [Thermoanaerobaculia bacterium]
MASPHLTVVIPAYNEAGRILPALARVHEYLSAQPYGWSVLVVSDGSTDGTDELVRQFGAAHGGFALHRVSPNRGKGCAVREGVLRAEGERVLMCDADLAAPIEEVEKLLAEIDRFPIVIGSRPLKESRLEVRQPWYREALGRAANLLVRAIGVRGIHDTQCGFKLFERSVARDVFSRCKLDGFSFDLEVLMIARDLGHAIREVPIRWAHQEGSKVVLWRDAPKSLLDLLRLRLAGRARRVAPRAER